MNKLLRIAALALLLSFGLFSSAARATVIFHVDTLINGDAPNRIDPAKPFVIISIANAGTDLVSIEIDATNLASENFVESVLLNYIGNPVGNVIIDTFPLPGASAATSNPPVLTGGAQVQAGLFNIILGFDTSASGERLNGGETATWFVSGMGAGRDRLGQDVHDGQRHPALQRPTLVISHNKTLAAQLYGEFKEFFPHNAVHYFVSYYDYYQPEAYIPQRDIYIEKDASINEEIDRLRLAATSAGQPPRRDHRGQRLVHLRLGLARRTTRKMMVALRAGRRSTATRC
jgi:hypothetical protein